MDSFCLLLEMNLSLKERRIKLINITTHDKDDGGEKLTELQVFKFCSDVGKSLKGHENVQDGALSLAIPEIKIDMSAACWIARGVLANRL